MSETFMNVIDTNVASQFLQTAFEFKPDGHHIQLFGLPSKRCCCVATVDEAVAEVERYGAAENIYYAVGTSARQLDSHSRAKADEVSGVIGFWADIDVRGPTHDGENVLASIDDAMWLVSQIPLEPSFIINSGTGVQAL